MYKIQKKIKILYELINKWIACPDKDKEQFIKGDTDANTYSQALSKDGKYFYSIDSTTMKVSLGYRTYT
jgi:hypothetical protein